MKVYGPYLSTDSSRRHVVVIDADGARTTYSYARWLWLTTFGPIPDGFVVDHRNGNALDDRLENLQLLTVAENNRKAVAQLGRTREMGTFTCPECRQPFERRMSQVRANNVVRGMAGPFCSRSCAGRYTYPGRDSNPQPAALEAAASASWTTGA